MAQFNGFVDRWSLRDAALELRLCSRAYSPDRANSEVEYVTVEDLADAENVATRLAEIEPYKTEIFLDDSSFPRELTLQKENGDAVVLRGSRVGLRAMRYEPDDYERLTRAYCEEVIALRAAVADTRQLLREQANRTAIKAQGHARGTTARTLYSQQLVFITRVLRTLGP